MGEQAEDFDVPIMTRPTWDKLKAELAAVERELKTTIPKTIQKARELGDLKENAEYHSAKLKQANAQKQAAALQMRVGRARFVEDAEYRRASSGSAPKWFSRAARSASPTGSSATASSTSGANVISFQAPIGKALVGHVVGDEVEIGEAGTRWRVESVVAKTSVRRHARILTRDGALGGSPVS